MQIFSFSGSGNPTQVIAGVGITTGKDPQFASWSPDGRFIAVVYDGNNLLQIFKFNGSGNLIQVTTGTGVTTTTNPQTVTWSPDGRFLAVTGYNNSELQIFSFTGSGNPTQLTTGTVIPTGPDPISAVWSPDGRFIAVVAAGSGTGGFVLQLFRANYIASRTPQAMSNSIVFGNSALGPSYDLNVRGLSGAQMALSGLINYDCVS